MKFNHNFLKTPELKQVTAEDGQRYYETPSGNRYESVTTWIGRNSDKTYLTNWKERVGDTKANSISNQAKKRGSALHGSIEDYLMNREVSFANILEKDMFNKMKTYLNNINNIRILESSLYSDRLKLAGTPDCIGDFLGVLSVIDFKTSTREKLKQYVDGYFLQGACYADMYFQHYKVPPKRVVILIATEDAPTSVFVEPIIPAMNRLEEFRKKAA